MKIYTKTGDAGQTSLYRGGRVSKASPRLGAYGTLDELNSALGMALAQLPAAASGSSALITRVQTDLFKLGAELATLGEAKPSWHLEDGDVEALEAAIDRMDAELPPMTTFVLPGGCPSGAALHLARTIARRGERELVALMDGGEALNPELLRYLNRLSDLLFVLARFVNLKAGTPEPPLPL